MYSSMPRLSTSGRQVLAKICFGLGSVWGVAGAFKLVFGVRLTFPLLPPLGLEQVAAVPAIGAAFALFVFGAYFGRVPTENDATARGAPAAEEGDVRLSSPGAPSEAVLTRKATPVPLRRPSV